LVGGIPSNLFRNGTRKNRNERSWFSTTQNVGQKIKGYVQYSDRIILVKIDTKPRDTVVIQVYMPTTEKENEEVENIYKELNDLMNTVKGEENLIILGDFNASVGEGRKSYIVGKYGLGVRNTRGDTHTVLHKT